MTNIKLTAVHESQIKEAINGLVASIQSNDVPEALDYCNALTASGHGFPLFSFGRKVVKHLHKSLYYHASLVTVHDTDVSLLKNAF